MTQPIPQGLWPKVIYAVVAKRDSPQTPPSTPGGSLLEAFETLDAAIACRDEHEARSVWGAVVLTYVPGFIKGSV